MKKLLASLLALTLLVGCSGGGAAPSGGGESGSGFEDALDCSVVIPREKEGDGSKQGTVYPAKGGHQESLI